MYYKHHVFVAKIESRTSEAEHAKQFSWGGWLTSYVTLHCSSRHHHHHQEPGPQLSGGLIYQYWDELSGVHVVHTLDAGKET